MAVPVGPTDGDGLLKLFVGAPVAERAWVLPEFFKCLDRQTLRPDGYLFVYSESQDNTLELLQGWAPHSTQIYKSELPYYPRSGENGRHADSSDKNRANHFSGLRNKLRAMLAKTDADLFLSLDTDVLLEDETVLEQLVQTLLGERAEHPRAEFGWDVVAPSLCLHPNGEASECYNAGFWRTTEPDYTQAWERANANHVLAYRSPLKIDIPMAAYVLHRHAFVSSRYTAHEAGEDLGFAQSLSKHGYRVGWRHDLKVRHVWSEQYL